METVEFYDTTTNIRKKRRGIKIGKHLAIVPGSSYGYKIYRVKKGIPVIDTLFTTQENACKFADWLNKTYKEYFDLWEDGYDVFSMTKWTVPKGLIIYEVLQRLPEQVNSLAEIKYNAEYENEWKNL